jgi:hypothetical protein
LLPSSTRRGRIDTACAQAGDLARSAAEELTKPAYVGETLGVFAEGDRIVTHTFSCLDPGYRGWHWAVTVTRAPRAKNVTVSEAVLLPGSDALLAPSWVPWSERLRPGDLGPGDLLPTADDDPRLAPGFAALADADADQQQIWELGLGRRRVLSADGRAEAAERWYAGDGGPSAPLAKAAPAHCSTCGFYLMLSGEMRRLFGVCANANAPDDGRVVSADHGCGAHSEAVTVPPAADSAPPIVDELSYDIIEP